MQISAYFCCEILWTVVRADLFGKTAETRTFLCSCILDHCVYRADTNTETRL